MKTKKKKHFTNTDHYIILNERIIHKAHLTIGRSYVLCWETVQTKHYP